jgi:hypothetical protein
MAGGFGFDAEKYEVSQAIAEQGAGRGTVHIAELAAACLRREA